jgi:hypothetical protein
MIGAEMDFNSVLLAIGVTDCAMPSTSFHETPRDTAPTSVTDASSELTTRADPTFTFLRARWMLFESSC